MEDIEGHTIAEWSGQYCSIKMTVSFIVECGILSTFSLVFAFSLHLILLARNLLRSVRINNFI